MFITATKSKLEQKLLWEWGVAAANQTVLFWGAGNTVDCSELPGLFCGSLEDRNAGSSADDGGSAWEVLENSRLQWGWLCDIFKFVEVKPFVL